MGKVTYHGPRQFPEFVASRTLKAPLAWKNSTLLATYRPRLEKAS